MAIQAASKQLKKQENMLDICKRVKRKADEAFWTSEIDVRLVKRPKHEQEPRICRKRMRNVDFNELANKVHYRSYGEGDLERSWIQQSEYKEIKEGTKKTLLAIKEAGGKLSHLDVKKHCVRGLENSVATLLFRADRRPHKRVIRRVLKVQHSQRADASAIKKLYATLSRNSIRRALDLARIDAS